VTLVTRVRQGREVSRVCPVYLDLTVPPASRVTVVSLGTLVDQGPVSRVRGVRPESKGILDHPASENQASRGSEAHQENKVSVELLVGRAPSAPPAIASSVTPLPCKLTGDRRRRDHLDRIKPCLGPTSALWAPQAIGIIGPTSALWAPGGDNPLPQRIDLTLPESKYSLPPNEISLLGTLLNIGGEMPENNFVIGSLLISLLRLRTGFIYSFIHSFIHSYRLSSLHSQELCL